MLVHPTMCNDGIPNRFILYAQFIMITSGNYGRSESELLSTKKKEGGLNNCLGQPNNQVNTLEIPL